MTEIPADLLRRVYVRTGHGAGGEPIVRRAHVDAVLAALAEWADGALIDPATWARARAEEVFAPEVTDLPLHMLTREDP